MRIKILHVINDTRIWPSFFYSSNHRPSESLFIQSLDLDELPFKADEDEPNALLVDNEVTVVRYQAKTLMHCLTEIAGLLVLVRIASFLLGLFHEYRYNSKMK